METEIEKGKERSAHGIWSVLSIGKYFFKGTNNDNSCNDNGRDDGSSDCCDESCDEIEIETDSENDKDKEKVSQTEENQKRKYNQSKEIIENEIMNTRDDKRITMEKKDNSKLEKSQSDSQEWNSKRQIVWLDRNQIIEEEEEDDGDDYEDKETTEMNLMFEKMFNRAKEIMDLEKISFSHKKTSLKFKMDVTSFEKLLDPEECLNDECISLYMWYLSGEFQSIIYLPPLFSASIYKETQSENFFERQFCISPLFDRAKIEKVEKWNFFREKLTNDLKQGKEKYLCIPICHSNHWFLIVWNMKTHLITWYDSIYKPERKNTSSSQSWIPIQNLVLYVKKKLNMDSILFSKNNNPVENQNAISVPSEKIIIRTTFALDFPIQSGSTECGWYSLIQCRILCKGLSNGKPFSLENFSFYKNIVLSDIYQLMCNCNSKESNDKNK